MKKNKKITRRKFMHNSAKGAAGLLTYSFLSPKLAKAAFSPNSANPKVVVVTDANAAQVSTNPFGAKTYTIISETAQSMMDSGIIELTGIDNIGEAWKSIFPDITKDKKICIKVNCIASGGGPYVSADGQAVSSHPEVAYAIVNGLLSMQFGDDSFLEENITVYDRADIEMKNAGYSINASGTGVQCHGSGNLVNSGSTLGYGSTPYSINGSNQYLSSIFEESDYVINLAVFKDHSFAGVTLSLKNHYGTIHMPESSATHGNNCNPAVAQLNAIEPIKQKQVLCICDAIFGIISGGPEGRPQVIPNKLVFGKDSVALDTVCTQILIDNGMAESKRTMAKYINTAATTYNLGEGNINNIDIIEIENTSSSDNRILDDNKFKIFTNYPNPARDETTFVYQLFHLLLD